MVQHKLAPLLLSTLLGSVAGFLKEEVELCPGSKPQLCKMQCQKPKCTSGGMFCATRDGSCCKFRCQLKRGSDGGGIQSWKDAFDKGKNKLKGDERATVVSDQLKACLKDGGSRQSCISDLGDVLENVTSSGRTAISKAQLDLDLKRAAAMEAGRAIMACAEEAATKQEKKACILTDQVREAVANATGKLESEISDKDLRKYAEESEKALAAQLLKACNKLLAGADKSTCLSDAQDQLKKLTGGTLREGRASAEQAVKEAAGDEALDLLRSCTPPTSSECKQQAREAIAESTGRALAKITDFDLDRAVRGATTRRIKELMKTCMEEAGDNSTDGDMTACKTEAREAMQEVLGRAPTEAEFLKEMDRISEEQAREALKTCGDDQAKCKAELRRSLAQSSGMRSEDIKDSDIKKFQRLGALKEGQDHLLACIKAAKEAEEDAQACLTESVDEIKAMAQSTGDRGKKLQKDLAKFLQESYREQCMKQATQEDVDACIQAGSEDVEGAMDEILKDVPAGTRDKLKKALQKAADVTIAGKEYMACRKAASTQQEKDACKAAVTTLIGKSDIAEDANAVLNRFRAKQLAQLASDCEGTQKECRREARAQAEEELGFKPRKYAMMKRLGVMKELAESFAACLEDGAEKSVCVSEAETSYIALTGGDAAAFAEIKEKVESLADAVKNGLLTRIVSRQEIEVEVGTSGSICDSQIGQGVLDKLEEERSTSPLLDAMTNFTEKPCKLLGGVPFYTVLVFTPDAVDADIETEAERLSVVFESAVVGSTPAPRRLGASGRSRRLAEDVSEVNSAQGVDEEVVTDAPTPAPSPGGTATPTPAPTKKTGISDTTNGAGRFGEPLLMAATLLMAAMLF